MIWREDFHGCASSRRDGTGLHDGLVMSDGNLKVILGRFEEFDVSTKLVNLILVVSEYMACFLFLDKLNHGWYDTVAIRCLKDYEWNV